GREPCKHEPAPRAGRPARRPVTGRSACRGRRPPAIERPVVDAAAAPRVAAGGERRSRHRPPGHDRRVGSLPPGDERRADYMRRPLRGRLLGHLFPFFPRLPAPTPPPPRPPRARRAKPPPSVPRHTRAATG